MPLPDDEVTRGKCGMKALQFMAVSRPVVLSPVGVNAQIVRHGQNGLLADSTDDFVSALLMLSRDTELRRQLGENARATIEEKYSAERASGEFAKVVRAVC